MLARVLGLLEERDTSRPAMQRCSIVFRKQNCFRTTQARRRKTEIAGQLGMTANAVRQAFHRFRQRYQSLLREEIAHTVATPGDVEDELRHLIAVVRT